MERKNAKVEVEKLREELLNNGSLNIQMVINVKANS
jgi:hypothetical protein